MKNDGGPAFPQTVSHSPLGDREFPGEYGLGGMSLRDWFAGQALKGSLNAFREGWAKQLASAERNKDAQSIVYEALASQAYAIADAMLTEREKGNG